MTIHGTTVMLKAWQGHDWLMNCCGSTFTIDVTTERKLLNKLLINKQALTYKDITNIPYNGDLVRVGTQTFANKFLSLHECIVGNKTKSVTEAQKLGYFVGVKHNPKNYAELISQFLTCGISAGLCGYTCAYFLGQDVSITALGVLMAIIVIVSYPVWDKIERFFKELGGWLWFVPILLLGAIMERNSNVEGDGLMWPVVGLFKTGGALLTILGAGFGTLVLSFFALMTCVDIFKIPKHKSSRQ